MRFAWIVLWLSTVVMGAGVVDVGEKFKDSGKCKSCHSHIVKQWEESWHAKSHYDNDEYFRKTIDYLGRKTSGKSVNSFKVECAACHNPRITVTSTNAEYDAIAALKLDKGSAVDKALSSNTISEGINCVVCHNIDQIHDGLPDTARGIHRVSWMRSGVMSGPYDDAKSPYHKTEQRPFMDANPNQLCFVCHANDTSEEGHRFIDMQSEYKSGSKQCVDCHMSPRKQGIASTLPIANGKPQKRVIREHGFHGAHTGSMWKGSLKVDVRKTLKGLEVTLTNPQPHALPSGFGSREILIEAKYTLGGKEVKTEILSLTTKYLSKRGKPTIPHLAQKTVESVSIPANGSKTFVLPMRAAADGAVVYVSYRLVNDEVREMLDLKDPLWSKKAPIAQVKVHW